MRRILYLTIVLTILFFYSGIQPVQAQQPPDQFVYTVQSGDTLSQIAYRHGLQIQMVARANRLRPPYMIYVGQELILPGVPLPTSTPVFSGSAPAPDVDAPNASSTPQPKFSPFEIGAMHTVQQGETLFSIAQLYDTPLNHIILANSIDNPDILQMGQVLQIPTGPPQTLTNHPDPFESVQLSESVIIQGRTLIISVQLSQVVTLRGDIDGRVLFFTGTGQRKWALAAIHPLAQSNQYPITLIATLPSGQEVTTYQSVTVVDGPYGSENIALNEETSSLLDPEISQAEWNRLVEIWSEVTPRPLWSGRWRYPVNYPSVYVTSDFGTRRSYGGGPVTSFHGGTDFAGGQDKTIYAPAAGRVVLAESLNVRGNAVLLDHGLGLYSGYWHQTEILVTEGQFVEPGDIIGYIGGTGLVTGPHLHWELRLNGFAVEPLQWTERAIP
ncbi:LysM peptidoglycan-binding domain-containing M23 family metallopeptidase [Anaerolineales bacterium HSG24]|nr:LysM peptidoglycan-binding domain-containing M23 family metallopeptidase [Anaerolineales bacterium HSG24]